MAFPAKSTDYQVQVLPSGAVRVSSPFNDFTTLHLAVFNNTTRPSAALFPPGYHIWNTDDNAPNFVDSASPPNWRDAVGNIT